MSECRAGDRFKLKGLIWRVTGVKAGRQNAVIFAKRESERGTLIGVEERFADVEELREVEWQPQAVTAVTAVTA